MFKITKFTKINSNHIYILLQLLAFHCSTTYMKQLSGHNELSSIRFLFFAPWTFMGKRAKQLTDWWEKLYNAELCSYVLMQYRDAAGRLEMKPFLSGAALLALNWDKKIDFLFLFFLTHITNLTLIALNTGYKERYIH